MACVGHRVCRDTATTTDAVVANAVVVAAEGRSGAGEGEGVDAEARAESVCVVAADAGRARVDRAVRVAVVVQHHARHAGVDLRHRRGALRLRK